jgi:hypothetical protein
MHSMDSRNVSDGIEAGDKQSHDLSGLGIGLPTWVTHA